MKKAVGEGYNIFDPNSNFYNDICTQFTNENGKRNFIRYFCKKGCKFIIGYNEIINMYTCNCIVESGINDLSIYETTPIIIWWFIFSKKLLNIQI